MEMRRVCPLLIADDAKATLDWYAERGFDVIPDISDDDLHLVVYAGEAFAQIMGAKEAHAWLPETADIPTGTSSGWLYINVDDAAAFAASLTDRVEVVKDVTTDYGRLFYFRDLNGYTIGVGQMQKLPF